MNLAKSLLFLTLTGGAMTSCVVPVYPVGGAYTSVGVSYGYYDSLPRGYIGDAYFYGGRYYYGGRYDSGRYYDHGHAYSGRYYHSGHYYYGGHHQHYSSGGHDHH